MNNFIIYSIEIAISLALFYSAYWLFLKKETFFKLNRLYLLSSVAISLLLPLLNITLAPTAGTDSFISKYIVMPIESYEQTIIGTIDNKELALRNKTGHHKIAGNMDGHGAAGISDPATAVSLKAEVGPADAAQGADDKRISWPTLALVIYLIGAALLLVRFIANFIRIFAYALKYRSQEISGVKVLRLEKDISPFSFLHLIFIGHKYYAEEELSKIISHEKIHIRQKHTLDLILFELLLVVQWFNPFAWLYKRAIKITHEYLADHGTLNSGIDMPAYHYSLLSQALSKNNIEIASTYNLSVKKRIDMMKKKRSSKLAVLKLAAALPLFFFLFSAFAFRPGSSGNEPGASEKERSMAYSDSSIKKVEVSVEYLKLLEGDYVSTNEPEMIRKIRFTEVLGTLIGNDAGYRYTLIPVGGEKFINPDDNATLLFNSKNKKAISLLLFGTVNLKKVERIKEAADFSKKSVAYSVAAVLEKEGIAPALLRYKEIKDSGKYDLNESEMNLVGYLLLKSNRAKEAAALFKLNTEAFPNSFNAYDSYGEALLALGEKAQAIDNYRKSVQINPGSKNGIKVLKELGVNTDSLVKEVKVPAEFLKLLEGEYISINAPGQVRRIRLMEDEGVLNGSEHGYFYKLMPVGEGKFINPDDGAPFVFNTRDKNAITFSFFGKINFKKLQKSEETIQKVEVSTEYLKLLAGEYTATDKNAKARKITFEEVKGVLVGTDDGYRYKLIPVGNGKFINPDDNAPFVFDTKNKNAITLLLFGKVNLKKVK